MPLTRTLENWLTLFCSHDPSVPCCILLGLSPYVPILPLAENLVREEPYFSHLQIPPTFPAHSQHLFNIFLHVDRRQVQGKIQTLAGVGIPCALCLWSNSSLYRELKVTGVGTPLDDQIELARTESMGENSHCWHSTHPPTAFPLTHRKQNQGFV